MSAPNIQKQPAAIAAKMPATASGTVSGDLSAIKQKKTDKQTDYRDQPSAKPIQTKNTRASHIRRRTQTYRGRQCAEPEAVFGQMKFNMAYRRFRHFDKGKVTMGFAFVVIAFNINTMYP